MNRLPRELQSTLHQPGAEREVLSGVRQSLSSTAYTKVFGPFEVMIPPTTRIGDKAMITLVPRECHVDAVQHSALGWLADNRFVTPVKSRRRI